MNGYSLIELLIELLIVLVIVGIIGAIAIPRIMHQHHDMIHSPDCKACATERAANPEP